MNIAYDILMESADGSLKNNLYFLSRDNHDQDILVPRVPENYFTKNGYEDNKTPRVCFAKSIDGALMALSRRVTGETLYVHTPINSVRYTTPTIKQVPDCKITGEVWVKEPVKIKYIGKILVTGDAGEDGIPFKYGDNTAYLYKWNWRWINEK
jgi:hypothetical protein